jgi:hypothetical protein
MDSETLLLRMILKELKEIKETLQCLASKGPK